MPLGRSKPRLPGLPDALLGFCAVAAVGVACAKHPASDAQDAGAATDATSTDVSPGIDVAGGSEAQSPMCTFAVTAQLSPVIKTVGIVTWASSLASVHSARIELGLTPSYGMTVPVDVKAEGYRTLLLGMKQRSTYHFRVVATSDDGECASSDYTLATESLSNGMPAITVSDKSAASPVFGGFLIAGQYLPKPSGGMPAYIVDADGDIVWEYTFPRDPTGVRMSYDGKSLWLNGANVPSTQGAVVHRVSMDGLTDEDLSDRFTGQNHQLVVLPDETVVFYAYGENGCEDIKEYSPATDSVRTIVNAGLAQGRPGDCHLTNIQYSAKDDSLVFSDLNSQAVTKIRRSDGATIWVLNGTQATLAGAPWKGGQHSLHLLDVNRFLLFNNNTRSVPEGAAGTGDGSIAMELSVDLDAKTVALLWSYKATPGIQNDVMGDLARLPNGNTLIAYSAKAVVHEVNADGVLLQEWTWPMGATFGYVEKRATLYGPPPR